jgi:spore coat polysaccharide biosynthesis predicted glycosyltransferase SpsG
MNIASGLNKDFQIVFASVNYAESIDIIKNEGYEVLIIPQNLDAKKEIELIKNYSILNKIKYCIIELVPNNSSYVMELSKFLKTMMVDFEGNIDVYSDILLCWDIDAADKKYTFFNNKTVKLLGSKFVPLNKDILKYKKKNQNKNINTITVTFGGSDPYNLTFKISNILNNLSSRYKINLITGPAFKQAGKLHKLITNKNIKIIESPKNIHEIFSKSDLAISNGGLTAFELCALNVPFIGISKIPWEAKRLKEMQNLDLCRFVYPNDNMQKLIEENLLELSNKKVRDKISINQKKFIDGNGAERISKEIMKRW